MEEREQALLFVILGERDAALVSPICLVFQVPAAPEEAEGFPRKALPLVTRD